MTQKRRSSVGLLGFCDLCQKSEKSFQLERSIFSFVYKKMKAYIIFLWMNQWSPSKRTTLFVHDHSASVRFLKHSQRFPIGVG